MPRDAVSRTANVERTGRQKWVKGGPQLGPLITRGSTSRVAVLSLQKFRTDKTDSCTRGGMVLRGMRKALNWVPMMLRNTQVSRTAIRLIAVNRNKNVLPFPD